MARFPYSDLESNIRRLVTAGHKVAVCERVQPGEARGKPVEKIIVGPDAVRNRTVVVPAPADDDLVNTVRHKDEVTAGVAEQLTALIGRPPAKITGAGPR